MEHSQNYEQFRNALNELLDPNDTKLRQLAYIIKDYIDNEDEYLMEQINIESEVAASGIDDIDTKINELNLKVDSLDY